MTRGGRRLMRREYSVATWLGGLGALLPGAAGAGVWTLEPQLATEADYSTNPQLSPSAAYGDSAAVLLGMPAAWDDGARHFDVSPSLRLAKASGAYYSGTNAYYLLGSASTQSDRSTWKANARWASDSTVLLAPSAGTLTRADFPRRSDSGGLEWSFGVSERAALDLSGSAESVGYSGAAQYGLYDYRDHGLQASLSQALTERYQLQVLVSTGQYTADQIRFSSTSSSAQGGIVGSLSPRWSFTALYGISRASADGGQQSPTGNVYLVSLADTGQRTSLKVSASQSLQPSGFGTVVRSTEVHVTGTWQSSERGALSLSATSARTEDVFGTLAFASRSYGAAAADWTWRASLQWTVVFDVNWQRARTNPGDALGAGWGSSLTAARKFGKVTVS